jgi:ketosteroid isomerase-like protein
MKHHVDTVRKFFDLLRRKEIETWSELWADDGRIIIFYPPEGSGPSIDGKAAIKAAFLDIFGAFEAWDAEITAIYPVADSESVVVEYKPRATLTGGVEYTNSNVSIFRFKGGLISSYHDYFDPRRFQVVIDALRQSPTGTRGTTTKS